MAKNELIKLYESNVTFIYPYHSNIVIFGLENGDIIYYDIEINIERRLKSHTDSISYIKANINDNILISCGRDNQIINWDLKTCTSISQVDFDRKNINALDMFNKDIFVYSNKSLYLIDSLTLDIVSHKIKPEIKLNQLYCLNFNYIIGKDDNNLWKIDYDLNYVPFFIKSDIVFDDFALIKNSIIACNSKTQTSIKLFNLENGSLKNEYFGHGNPIIHLSRFKDQYLCSIDNLGTLKIWNPTSLNSYKSFWRKEEANLASITVSGNYQLNVKNNKVTIFDLNI